jgi:hypothetical protein
MASYHLSVKVGKVGNAARHSKYINREERYQEKQDLEYVEHGNMPSWAKDNPNEFWKAADDNERVNGRTYTEIEVALPNELTPEQRIELVQSYVKEQIGDNHPYSFAIHCPKAALSTNTDQPHAHIMFSERMNDGIERDAEQYFKRGNSKKPELGGAKKDLSWHNKETVEKARQSWAELQNKALDKYGHEARVDHRSLEDQRKDAIEKGDLEKAELLNRSPEYHLGPKDANRSTKDAKDYVKDAKTREEMAIKREEYFEKHEKSNRVKSVYYSRELQRTEKALRYEKKLEQQREKLLKQGGPVDKFDSINVRIGEVNKELTTLTEERRELLKKVITPERSYAIAKHVFTNGITTQIEQQRRDIEKEKDQFSKDSKRFELRPKPGMFDQERKEYEAEGKRLENWQKDLSSREHKHNEVSEAMSSRLKTPEAVSKIEEIRQGVLKKNEPQRLRLEQVDNRMKELRDARTDLVSERNQLMMEKRNGLKLGQGQQMNIKGPGSPGISNHVSQGINSVKSITRTEGTGGGVDAKLHTHDEEERRKKQNEIER